MTITLGENLKKLRRQKGNTQEELAQHLGISVQAVSKWERDEGYPDITLLPAIALYYDTTVDCLLGVEESAINAKIEAYIEQGLRLGNQGKAKERVALWREVQKEFPNNHKVLMFLMYALNMRDDFEEVINIGQRLLRECTDNEIRYHAIQVLCGAHVENQDYETAKKHAEMAPSHLMCREVLYGWCVSGEESILHHQASIRAFIDTIYDFVKVMCNTGNMPEEDKIKAYEFAFKLLDALYPNGDYSYEEYDIATLYLKLAACHASLGDMDKALAYLSKVPHHMHKFDTQKVFQHTSFMVNRLHDKPEGVTKRYEYSHSEFMLRRVKNEKAFDRLREDPRYQKIIEQLKK